MTQFMKRSFPVCKFISRRVGNYLGKTGAGHVRAFGQFFHLPSVSLMVVSEATKTQKVFLFFPKQVENGEF